MSNVDTVETLEGLRNNLWLVDPLPPLSKDDRLPDKFSLSAEL